MIEPIPHADKTDVAEQARSVDDDEQCDALPDLLGDDRDAGIADLFDQNLYVTSHDDDHPPATSPAVAGPTARRTFWSAWESNSRSTQRSFIHDIASRGEPYRPNR